jgi:hypothetical protein
LAGAFLAAAFFLAGAFLATAMKCRPFMLVGMQMLGPVAET